MVNSDNEKLDDAIRIESHLPLSWQALADPLSEGDLLLLNDNNLVLLNAIAFMEAEVHTEVDDHSGVSQELARIDAKIELLMALVSRLVDQRKLLPSRHLISLSSSSLQWSGQGIAAQPAERGLFSVFLHPAVAVPVTLPVEIVANGQARIRGLSSPVQNSLEKYLFRQHRRSIAGARNQ